MFEKLSVQELFPTPLWICDLAEAHHRRLNADLKARIEALIEPRAGDRARLDLADRSHPPPAA